MRTGHAFDLRSGLHQGLERWDRWLQEALFPAMVVLRDSPDYGSSQFRWTVDFPFGLISSVRIPRSLVEASREDFQRVTDGLGSYSWETALEYAGPGGLTLDWAEVS